MQFLYVLIIALVSAINVNAESMRFKIAHEYDEIEDLKIAEDRDDYTE